MNGVGLCIPPPAQYRVRGVAHGSHVWTKDPLAPGGLWRVVDVLFMGGNERQRTAVAEIVQSTWNQLSGLQFAFTGKADAAVRIAFEAGASWSQPGNYGMNGPFEQPTMNFGWLHGDTAWVEWERVVCHEFGHALALMHEHQNPTVKIPWNRPAVYAWFRKYQGWPPEIVDSQVLVPLGIEVARATRFDPASVMVYGIPAEILLDPSWAMERNSLPSMGDAATVQMLYGPPPVLPAADNLQSYHFPIVRNEGD